MASERQKYVSSKIRKIEHEGLRGKEPKPGQAAAVAYSMWKERKK
jgi:hypothetical protein